MKVSAFLHLSHFLYHTLIEPLSYGGAGLSNRSAASIGYTNEPNSSSTEDVIASIEPLSSLSARTPAGISMINTNFMLMFLCDRMKAAC